ncbi:hypothetical protein [Bradyrhizobium sp. CB2312]|uniref:hypothetical protein n=1 Tax=Bradyrhizobium sp. CB2312 TaxID=3039155 RepID=UPI0024B06357|nr:hypothetical protein [Bradyrhizobium sp. CB2312]WFU74262.1 hypothetical protein QA642_09540 [Bradyrhizobium sp. CB2312]
MEALGKALETDLDGHEEPLRAAFALFANSIVADISIGRRLHLSNYLSDLAKTAEHLVDLIEEPSNISDEYPLVHYQLTSNWDKARSSLSKGQLANLARELRSLFDDATRIAKDHPAEKRAAGRKSYAAARELLLSLRSLAMQAGVELSNNRNRDAFRRFKSFATIAIGLAASKGRDKLEVLKLPDELDKGVRTALGWQERLVIPRLSWHLREALKEEDLEQKSNL